MSKTAEDVGDALLQLLDGDQGLLHFRYNLRYLDYSVGAWRALARDG